MSKTLAETDPSDPGAKYVRTVRDSFSVDASTGQHTCLLYETMRESITIMQLRLKDEKFPRDLLQTLIRMLLTGLNYMHSRCGIIHTGKLMRPQYNEVE